MPIELSPPLDEDAASQAAALTAQNAQFAQAITTKQGQIDGTSGTPPGLTQAEAVNAELYSQYSTRLGYFEDERQALDGVYPAPVVTEADITQAAQSRSGVLFPISNLTLTPDRLDPLDGLGGAGADNEQARLADEDAAITTLLGLPLIDRAGDDAYDDWVASLSAQASLLQTQSTAIALNESYGTSHAAWVQAQAALSYVLGLLPGPAVDDTTLNARAALIAPRQAEITARLAVLLADSETFYDDRFTILQGRVNLIVGTQAQLLAAQAGIQTLTDVSTLNSALIALYNGLV